MLEEHLALIISLVSVASTIIAMVLFFGKLKWTQEQHETKVKELALELEHMEAKVDDLKNVQQADVKTVLVKVDAIDKAVIGLNVSMGYIKDMVAEIKEKVNG